MTKTLRRWNAGATGITAALIVTSCAYDPYYSGAASSSGYEDGYRGSGYGGGSVSTSLFISTGNPRWGYDPSCYSYYDYNRRAYYDPYLYGYYPVGYRPPIVYGTPHPYGWRPGNRHCPPPRRISNNTLSNYRDREGSYRRSSYSWANQVRQRDSDRRIDRSPQRDDRYSARPYDDGRRNDRDFRNQNDDRSNQRPGYNYDRNNTRPYDDGRRNDRDFRNQNDDRSSQRSGYNYDSSAGRANRFDSANPDTRPRRESIPDRGRENQRSSPPSGFNNLVATPPQQPVPQNARIAERQRPERVERPVARQVPNQPQNQPEPTANSDRRRPRPEPRNSDNEEDGNRRGR